VGTPAEASLPVMRTAIIGVTVKMATSAVEYRLVVAKSTVVIRRVIAASISVGILMGYSGAQPRAEEQILPSFA